jgi:AsmA-like C-terminal region
MEVARMRFCRRLLKILILGLILCLSTLAGALWFAYSYVTDSETVSKLIREQGLRYFPQSLLKPGSARVSVFAGEIVLNRLQLLQRVDGAQFETLYLPYLNVKINLRKLVERKLQAREIRVSWPTLRLRQRSDRTWNLEDLFADPWPGPWIDTPPILIRNATIELIPYEEPAAPPVPAQPVALTNRALSPWELVPRGLSIATSGPVIGTGRGPAVFRDVALKIESNGGPGLVKFEGTARGDAFDRLGFSGTIDFTTGRITLDGELMSLTIKDALKPLIPRDLRPAVESLALNAGLLDLESFHVQYDPQAHPSDRLHYRVQARVHEGVWECPKLPFFVHDVSALLVLEDGLLTIKHAGGSNGSTTLGVKGTIGLVDPANSPLDLRIDVTALELDKRLRDRTPREYDDLWDVFRPRGLVNVTVNLTRQAPGQPVDVSAIVFCRDVSAVYRHFPYELNHLTGQLALEKKTLTVDLHSFISGQPIKLSGVIEDPGVDAVVKLDIEADSVPIDETLKKAMPPDVRKVVNQFDPRGFVKASAKVFRRPLPPADGRPEGQISIDALIDLNDRCEITWDRLPYPIRSLKGRLEVHPDRWVFKNMRGTNGRARISASGSVIRGKRGPAGTIAPPGAPKTAPGSPAGDDPLTVDVYLEAQELPFSGDLKDALPPAWRNSWPILNPTGACDVDAEVHVAPGRPDRTHIVITPRADSNVRLRVTRSPQPGLDPGATIELPMEDVHGRFVVDDGKVTMNDVNFMFRGAPVRFARGTVSLEDSGRFGLSVNQLLIEAIRFDADLRHKMPPIMQLFALKLDDGKTFRARGNLQIGWTGRPGDPAWCRWTDTLVVFNGNSIKTAIPIEHMEGQLDHVSGWSNGLTLQVEGHLNLSSVIVLGQQITDLESPFHVRDGVARLESVHGRFLKGELASDDACWITLDATPRYHSALSLQGAQLEEYARTIPGRQSYRGNISARLELNGLGSDIRSLHGGGEGHITQGDLGELPALLRFAKVLNGVANINLSPAERPRSPGKTAFDSADIAFTVNQGLTTFDPIKFTGNAFSLLGQGTLDPGGKLDLRLNVLLGRDRLHFPVLSDLAREASAPFFIVHVQGTPSYPQFQAEALPLFTDWLKRLRRGTGDQTAP